MVGLTLKFKASTLIENLVAMILISIVITFSFLFIEKINKSYRTNLATYAFLEANKKIENCENISLGESTIYYQSFSLIIVKEIYADNPSLNFVKIQCWTTDSIKLCEIKQIKKINLLNNINNLR